MIEESTHWLQVSYFLMPTWKWLVLVGVFAAGIFLFSLPRYVFGKIKALDSLASRKQGFWFYYSKLQIEGPVTWIALSMLWLFTIDSLALPVRMDKYVSLVVKVLLAFNVVRLAYIGMDAVGSVLQDYTAKTPSTLDDHLAPLAVKSAKVFIVILGILIALQNFGVNVMSLLAGLGLGGLALALAAQDAAANLIGSVMIILDRPFSIGDAIKVADIEGTVESIGFRSTRVRTGYNSLITVPNSMMAKEKIDNMGLRPYRRVRQVLGLHYDTAPELIEHFCARVRYIIAQEPTTMKETIQVNFNQFADSTLNVLVIFHLHIFDLNEEMDRTQKIFCEIINAAKEMGVVFAYPTQTVYYMQGAEITSSSLHKAETNTQA
jgi:MscS family membrane protein